MVAEATREFPLETGGVLAGYIDSSSGDTVVQVAVGPGPKAIHRPNRFLPDHDYHEKEIATIYAESGRTQSYVGDWHTHPHGNEKLSLSDRRTLARIARAPGARAPKPLMVVLAGAPLTTAQAMARDDSNWRPSIWQLLQFPSRWSAAVGSIRPAQCHLRVLTDHRA